MTILDAVTDIVGGDNVVSDEKGRDFFSAEYRSLMEPETWKLTQGIKQLVDPDGLVNPGSLGL